MKRAGPLSLALPALLLLFSALPSRAAMPKAKPLHFPVESLSVNYLSKELRIVTRPDSAGGIVDSTIWLRYVEFRLDTLVFDYRADGDTTPRTLRVAKKRINGFYYQPPVVGRSALIMGAGLIAVILLFVL